MNDFQLTTGKERFWGQATIKTGKERFWGQATIKHLSMSEGKFIKI